MAQKMNKYAMPTITFPYKITNRLNVMAIPRKQAVDPEEGMPKRDPITGVRISAIHGRLRTDRINEVAWPYVKRLITLKMMYREKFSRNRLDRLDRMIAASNGTIYSKLSNSVVILRKPGAGDDLRQKSSKKKSWTESDWRKHMDYISQISNPKPIYQPEPIDRGPHKPLQELIPRLEVLSTIVPLKMYKRISQDDWYRDPIKVSPAALKYVISERVKKLAEPKVLKPED